MFVSLPKLLLFVLCVLFSSFAFSNAQAPADLSTLTAKFQSLISELGAGASVNTYESEIASMLQRLEKFQSTQNAMPQNTTTQWVSGTITKAAPMRIILVVPNYEGMYLNSGIGAFYAALSDFLVEHGHSVKVLYTKTDSADTSSVIFNRWQASLEKKGVSVARLDPLSVHVTSPSHTKKSYQIFQYLNAHQQDFDVVHFPEIEGSGYFSVLAKHQGLAFSSNLFVVGLHAPWRWVQHGNQEFLPRAEDLETDWLERRSVELADAIVTPTADLSDWLVNKGWDLPAVSTTSAPTKLSVMPFLPGKEIQTINRKNKDAHFEDVKTSVKEFVFFGRLEVRKGVVLFSDALDLLAQSRPELASLKITFMGKNTDINKTSATQYLAERAEKGHWPFKVSYITHKDRKGALEYLREDGKGRVAVMPSVVDTAPYTVYECLYSRVPFIASKIPSAVALVSLEDREKVFFEAEAVSVLAMMQNLIDNGASTARSAVSIEDALSTWDSFYNTIYTLHRAMSVAVTAPLFSDQELPLVSVCIPTYNRPQLLQMAIESVLAQDYPSSKIEVVLVDDGSTKDEALAYLDELEALFAQRNWQIIRTENRYLGAARNTAARAANGEYLLFLDDDNLATPQQISTYLSVARVTGAQLLTAAHEVFEGTALPVTDLAAGTNILSLSLPLGPAVSVGIFKNCFGDANFFINKNTFLKVGGFTEERGVGAEDYEFLAKAVLSGVTLEAIPKPLLYYRMHNKTEQMLFTTDNDANAIRSVRPYASILETQSETDDLLKLLAHRRVGKRDEAGLKCNMTVLSMSPTSILQNQEYTINFTAVTMDCHIHTVFFGKYPCISDTLSQNPAIGNFYCRVPPIPFAYNYSVSVTYDLPGGLISDNNYIPFTLEVKKIPSGTTLAVLAVQFVAIVDIYTLQKLLAVFNQLLGDAAGLALFTIIKDVSGTVITTKRTTSSQDHDMQFSITSSDPDTSATGMAMQLIAASTADPAAYSAIGVTIKNFNLVGTCGDSGTCVCGPTYSGDACDSEALCPNNCSAHGICGAGPFGVICLCDSGYTGTDCSVLTCPDECNGNGLCTINTVGTDGPNTTTTACTCFSGWMGEYCETRMPCASRCSKYGTCHNETCVCQSGYYGDDCSSTALNIHDGANASSSSDDAANTGLWVSVAFVSACLFVSLILGIYIYMQRRRRAPF